MSVNYGSLPFEEAISFLQDKVNVTGAAWDSLWRGEHARAFTVAGAMQHDLLSDIRKAMHKARVDGVGYKAFKKEFKGIISKHGWEPNGGADWRAKVIYQTNMRSSYNAGRWQQLQQFDYWQYHHGDSANPREQHLSWNNLVLAKADPWWQSHYPINGFGCSCWVSGISERALKRRGLKVSDSPQVTTYEYLDKKTGEVIDVPEGIGPGFDYNVGDAAWGRRVSEQAHKEANALKGKIWKPLTPGNYQLAKRPERLPLQPMPRALGKRLTTQDQAIAALRNILGGEERLIDTPIGKVLVNAEVMGSHIDPNRGEFLPLLLDLLAQPQEIWSQFSEHQVTGKVVLRQRYVKTYDLGKAKSLMAVFEASKGVLTGWTLLPTRYHNYLNKQRRGALVWVAE